MKTTPKSMQEIGAQEPSREDQIMGSSKALATILKLSIGPLFSQVTNSMYGFVNTLWLGSAVSSDATSALATATTIDSMAISFGFFLSTCAAARIAALFGQHQQQEAAQVIADLIRLALIFGCFLPAVLLPVSQPLMKWFGADPHIRKMGFHYLIPIMSGSCITCTYLLLCGCLQAEGRTILFAVVQVSAMILNAGVFNPLYLLAGKFGIVGASLSIISAQFIPAVCLLVCYFMGKFTVKPTFRGLISKPSKETWEACKTGFSSLIGAVSATLPSIFFQKFIGASSGDSFNIMMSMYNSYNRIYQIAVALFLAITQGFLSSASYAYGANRYRRVMFMLFHCFWLVSMIGILFTIIMFALNSPVAKIFNNDPLFLERFWKCAPRYWSTITLCSWQYVATAFLQAIERTTFATVVSFVTQFLMWPFYSFVFYYTGKHDVVRLFTAVCSNDISSVAFAAPFVVYAFIVLRRQSREGAVEPEKTSEIEEAVDDSKRLEEIPEL